MRPIATLIATVLLATLAAGCGEGGPSATPTPERSAAPAKTPDAAAPILDAASFAALAGRLPGREGVAVSGVGRGQPVEALGTLRGGVAWSTAKVPVVMAALAAGNAPTPDMRLAITASDNAAAERVFAALGSPGRAAAAATAQVRAAGDPRTVVERRRLREGFTAFGQTGWSLADQARFAAGLACAPAGPAVLELMGEVVAEQRWGLAAVDPGAAIKSGWGPGVSPGRPDGWLERQMGVMTVDGRPLAVTLAADAGDHETAVSHLDQLAEWVASHADVRELPATAAC